MYYTLWELILFFFVYAFLGWALMVAVSAFRTGRFVNPGLLNGPYSLTCGTVVTIMAVLATSYATNYLGQFVLAVILISVVTTCSGD